MRRNGVLAISAACTLDLLLSARPDALGQSAARRDRVDVDAIGAELSRPEELEAMITSEDIELDEKPVLYLLALGSALVDKLGTGQRLLGLSINDSRSSGNLPGTGCGPPAGPAPTMPLRRSGAVRPRPRARIAGRHQQAARLEEGCLAGADRAGPDHRDMPNVGLLYISSRGRPVAVRLGNLAGPLLFRSHPSETSKPAWRRSLIIKLPEGKILIPGVVSHATNVVEHPEVVADRILNFARVAGRENVIAGTDCGLGGRIHPQLVWAKLETLVAGAKLATKELWS